MGFSTVLRLALLALLVATVTAQGKGNGKGGGGKGGGSKPAEDESEDEGYITTDDSALGGYTCGGADVGDYISNFLLDGDLSSISCTLIDDGEAAVCDVVTDTGATGTMTVECKKGKAWKVDDSEGAAFEAAEEDEEEEEEEDEEEEGPIRADASALGGYTCNGAAVGDVVADELVSGELSTISCELLDDGEIAACTVQTDTGVAGYVELECKKGKAWKVEEAEGAAFDEEEEEEEDDEDEEGSGDGDNNKGGNGGLDVNAEGDWVCDNVLLSEHESEYVFGSDCKVKGGKKLVCTTTADGRLYDVKLLCHPKKGWKTLKIKDVGAADPDSDGDGLGEDEESNDTTSGPSASPEPEVSAAALDFDDESGSWTCGGETLEDNLDAASAESDCKVKGGKKLVCTTTADGRLYDVKLLCHPKKGWKTLKIKDVGAADPDSDGDGLGEDEESNDTTSGPSASLEPEVSAAALDFDDESGSWTCGGETLEDNLDAASAECDYFKGKDNQVVCTVVLGDGSVATVRTMCKEKKGEFAWKTKKFKAKKNKGKKAKRSRRRRNGRK